MQVHKLNYVTIHTTERWVLSPSFHC